MLLTGGQTSVVISSCVGWCFAFHSSLTIVFIFTFSLFLSGYVLQQRTVHSLQKAIRPALPAKPPAPESVTQHLGKPRERFYHRFFASNRPRGGWSRVAYVQVVRDHVQVCGAIMLFAALQEQRSMAPRILIYPSEWDHQVDPDRLTTRSERLLHKAASFYGVDLLALDKQSDSAYSEEQYPLLSVLSLTTFNRIVLLTGPGLILHAAPVDRLFTLPLDKKSWLALAGKSVVLLEPSDTLYRGVSASSDKDFLNLIPQIADSATPSVLQTSLLHNISGDRILSEIGFIHFSDDRVRGPEYDTSRDALESVAPTEISARIAWFHLYEQFRDVRMAICGLDLEHHVEII